uniref:Uncharacterized protein n=1 Tax=Arundo donax TaxID=35708 RepID=A0A0A9HA43_ARUDO
MHQARGKSRDVLTRARFACHGSWAASGECVNTTPARSTWLAQKTHQVSARRTANLEHFPFCGQ